MDATLTLEDIKPGIAIAGVIPGQSVTVIAATPMGAAIDLFYTTADGGTGRARIFVHTSQTAGGVGWIGCFI